MHAVHVVEALSHTDEATLINSFALPRKGLRQRYARDLHALYQVTLTLTLALALALTLALTLTLTLTLALNPNP